MANGTKQIVIDWEKFESLCRMQCTLREIADAFNCSEATIERRVTEKYGCRFVDIFKRKRQGGLISLRQNMFKMAAKHPNMAIFLAKNWLGMTDKQEIEHSGNIGNAEELTDEELASIIKSRGSRGISKETEGSE